jgi:hypothetical protein
MESQMTSDDSNLVEDILNEMNNGAQMSNLQPMPSSGDYKENSHFNMNKDVMYNQQQQQQINRQIDPSLIQQNPMTQQYTNTEKKMPPRIQVNYPNKEGTLDKAIRLLKKPIIVMLLVFIVFNPLLLTKISNLVPMFNTNGIMWKAQLRAGILSIIVGLLFLLFNMYM